MKLVSLNRIFPGLIFNKNSKTVIILCQLFLQLNTSLAAFTQQTLNIEEDLEEVERTLDQLNEYDGSVNMTDVMDLEQHLLALNTSVAMLSLVANQSLARLLEDQERIYAAWDDIQMLDSDLEGILVNFTEGEATVEPIEALISSANETYRMLRQNLTILDVQADRLARQLNGLVARADNASVEAALLDDNFAAFSEEVEWRRMEVVDLLALAQVLNDSVLSLELAAAEAQTSASNLMVRDIDSCITISTKIIHRFHQQGQLNIVVAIDVVNYTSHSFVIILAGYIQGVSVP